MARSGFGGAVGLGGLGKPRGAQDLELHPIMGAVT